MISRFAAVLLRAMAVILLIALPSLLLPGTHAESGQIVALIAIFAAGLTIFEYSTSYPCLVEFRDAPPFNRIRFAALFVTVLLISLLIRGSHEPTTLTVLIETIGALVGHAIDFPYSPVRLAVLMLPPDTSPAHIALVRMSAGLAYLVALVGLALFLIALRVKGWPRQAGAFNVWINLPTFDPTAGGDVVERLERDARFNIALGFLLPFLVPAVIKSMSTTFGLVALSQPQSLIWTISAWAFLPASLFMRGIAMGRIAAMIEAKRNEAEAARDDKLVTV